MATNALIDNSTLTAVERVLGRIPVADDYDLAGDLSAFESYLAALLFYDNPSRIDDYKPEHSTERASFFKEIGALSLPSSDYEQLLQQARDLTSDIMLRIHGGRLSGDMLSSFLKDIDLFVSPAWLKQSSDFYLRIRLLSDGGKGGIEKYTPLMTAIFAQLSEGKKLGAKPDWRKELTGSDGNPVQNKIGEKGSTRKIGPDINAFAASLNWLSLRSVFYSICSEHLQATVIPHPIRSDFIAQYYQRKLNAVRPDQREAVLSYFRSTAEDLIGSANAILGGPTFKLRTPLISAWAVAKAGKPSEARSLILDTRFSPEGVALRARMRDIEDLHQEGDADRARQAAAKLFRDFDASISTFFRKYGRKSEDPYGVSANIISMSGSFKVLPLADRVAALLPGRRRSVSLLRNITLDILQSPKLGGTADLLRCEMKRTDENGDFAYRPKVDHPRFARSSTDWKEPM